MSSLENRKTNEMRAAVREAMKTGSDQSLVDYLKTTDDKKLRSRLTKAVLKIERLREYKAGNTMALLSRIIAECEKDEILKSKLNTSDL